MDTIVYRILIVADAEVELATLRAFDRKRVMTAIKTNLSSEPTRVARNRKLLKPIPGFAHLAPVWELRIGEIRVYYTPNENEKTISVWAVRRKGRRITGEVL